MSITLCAKLKRTAASFLIISSAFLIFCLARIAAQDGLLPDKIQEVDAAAFSDLSSAMTDPETVGKSVIVSRVLSVHNLIVPQNRTLTIIKGGMINISTGGTLTIKSAFSAGEYQVFGTSGTVVFGERTTEKIYPQWWGAIADGKTDCYESLRAMAASVNASGGGDILFPKGTYFIGKYKITGGTDKNGVSDIVYQNCSRLHVSGYGAKINIFGKFNRSADRQIILLPRILKYSYTNCVTPFLIRNCSNVKVEGLELNGNVDKMTRDKGVVESHGYGIKIEGGVHFLLKDLFVHHFHTDGMILDGNKVGNIVYPCRNGSLVNIISVNNARQGLSVIQARDVTCTDCLFADTGITGGEYGMHAPAAGVDVEPNHYTDSPRIKAHENTGNITFLRCRFENNRGSQFNAAHSKTTGSVVLKDCSLDAKMSRYRYSVIFAVNGGLMENCTIDAGNGSVYAGWNKFGNVQKVIIRGCSIKSRLQGIVSQNDADVLIEKNRIANYAGGPGPRRYAVLLKNKNCVFRDNRIFMPKEAFSGADSAQIASYLDVRASAGNTFETDLMPRTGEHFATEYGPKTLVENDRYPPRSAMPPFRPFRNATGDFSAAYSRKPGRY